MKTSASSLYRTLRQRLGAWYDREARDLPWRRDVSAYHVLLSEVILQQTRVDQGMSYYHRFTEAFPTVYDLAAASEDEVLLLWQGLGYYSRGRNLRRAAQIIVSDFGGELPRTLEELSRLPGVGPYTRGAILSFAYNLPFPTVDGNVYRVLSRLFALSDPIDTGAGQRVYWQLAEELLDREHPSRHNQALIELGALCCTPRSPHCPECPVQEQCEGYRRGIAETLPIKQGKTRVRPRYMYYFLVRLGEAGATSRLLRRRGAGDIWQGLYELPLIEGGDEPLSTETLLAHPRLSVLLGQLRAPRLHPQPRARAKHRLSHQQLYAELYLIEAEELIPPTEEEQQPWLLIPEAEQERYALPVLLTRLLEEAED